MNGMQQDDYKQLFTRVLTRYGYDTTPFDQPERSPVALAREAGVAEAHITGTFQMMRFTILTEAQASDHDPLMMVGQVNGEWVYAHSDPFDPHVLKYGAVAFYATTPPVLPVEPRQAKTVTPPERDTRQVKTIMEALNVLGFGNIQPTELEAPNYHLQLLSEGRITPEQLAKAMAHLAQVPYIYTKRRPPHADVRNHLSAATIKRYNVIPYSIDGSELTILMTDASDDFAVEAVQQELPHLTIKRAVTNRPDIDHLMVSLYRRAEQDALLKQGTGDTNRADQDRADPTGPVAERLRTALQEAALDEATDLHFQPTEDGLSIRERIHGNLVEKSVLPADVGRQMINQMMMLCGMSLESQVPLDSRHSYKVTLGGRERHLRLRVSFVPTIHGRSLVQRLLPEVSSLPGLENVGLSTHNYELLTEALRNSNGIVLATGPTGSGKTTLMHDILRRVNRPNKKVVAVEDPVEYVQPGILQTEVRITEDPKSSLTFATVLRGFLRHDPDIMFIGEIRDTETAAIAASAANTGHLVLSTLHTNSAAGAVGRLLELGIEPYLIADNLRAVVAQRLIGRPCPECSVTEPIPAEFAPYEGATMRRGTKLDREGNPCPYCHGTGDYRQMSVQEVLVMSPEVRDAINSGDLGNLEVVAQAAGMRTLMQDGLDKVALHQINLSSLLERTNNFVPLDA